MAIVLELYELKNLCMEMAELGAANYIRKVAPGQDEISQREAYRLFGETRVKTWIRVGLVAAQRGGVAKNSKKMYSRAELEAAKKSETFNKILNK